MKRVLLLLAFVSIFSVVSSAQILGFKYSHAIDAEEDLIPGSNKKGYNGVSDIVYLTFTNKMSHLNETDSEGQIDFGSKGYRCESYDDGWYKYETSFGVYYYLFNEDFTVMRRVSNYSNPKISYVYKRNAPNGNKSQSDQSVKSRLEQVREMLMKQK